MKLDKSIAVLAMVASLILAVGAAAAQDEPSGTSISEGATLAEYFNTSEDTIDLDGGNVTQANLSAEQSTDNWAGLYGNATGSLILGTGDTDASSSTLYEWDADAQTVFAASGSVEWVNLSDSNATNVNNYYSLGADSDNATETLTTQDEPVDLDEETYLGDAVRTNNGDGNGVWTTVALEDNSSDTRVNGADLPVFAGFVGEGDTAFNGDVADYQLMLPADDSANAETYNMYLELG